MQANGISMTKQTVKLNKDIAFDLPKLIDSRLLIQANSGGGKSYAIRRIIEQAFGKVQIIVLDPEGEFTNLREKFDFVYAGKGGDAPVEPRSAAMLAHKLLELKASTIIDLYELPPQERKHFVRLFCEAMVNSPKELWHEVLVIIDEAHVFAPEKGESEAMGPVIDLATRGRKRGYCVVLATQRLPKLNKDAAAECNNKLIGRASQDIDRKRAAEELGFTTKEQILSLRDLSPGEFYVFGPAISREVQKIHIGLVKVTPPKRGTGRSVKIAPPTAKVKALLAKLADLPQAAAEEAKTIADFKKQNTALKAENSRLKAQPPVAAPVDTDKLTKKAYDLGIAAAETVMRKELDRMRQDSNKEITRLQTVLRKVTEIASGAVGTAIKIEPIRIEMPPVTLTKSQVPAWPYPKTREALPLDHNAMVERKALGTGERLILKAIGADSEGLTTEHIAVLTGYKATSRRLYLQNLKQRGFVKSRSDVFQITPEGIEELGNEYQPLPADGSMLQEYMLRTLPLGERKILQILVDRHPEGVGYQEIEDLTSYKSTSRRLYIQNLAARKLVMTDSETKEVRAADKLFD